MSILIDGGLNWTTEPTKGLMLQTTDGRGSNQIKILPSQSSILNPT